MYQGLGFTGLAFGFGLHGAGDTGALGIFGKMLLFGALGIALSWLQATWWKHLDEMCRKFFESEWRKVLFFFFFV